jgi:anti-sigma regulatory factor (Ser/Thr protein kinase)
VTDNRLYESAIQAIDRFLESVQEIQSPFDFATSLVKVTAQQYKADIASLFRVTPSRTELIAAAGYDQRGDQLRANASYYLKWDARREADMPGGGLTAWVAVSGQSLFIPNANELLDRARHPAHRGIWDAQLHPRGPEETFGCLYAVPLRLSSKRPPHESVVGVYKIERRRQNPEGVFTPEQLADFDLAGKQISLVILLYERALQRVLSDARHGIGPLEDVVAKLDYIREYSYNKTRFNQLSETTKLERVLRFSESAEDDAAKIVSRVRQSLLVFSNPLDLERRTILEFLRDTIEARTFHQYGVKLNILPGGGNQLLHMTLAQAWDLNMLLLCLLNNAHEHSGAPHGVSVEVRIEDAKGHDGWSELKLTVRDEGTKGIAPQVLREARESSGETPAGRGTGLRRVFRVAAFRDWPVKCESGTNGTGFDLTVRQPN